jgi:hypothetical protein
MDEILGSRGWFVTRLRRYVTRRPQFADAGGTTKNYSQPHHVVLRFEDLEDEDKTAVKLQRPWPKLPK